MAGDVGERAPKGGKKGVRRPKRRVAIRIDMTPMVDIAFLLLIFYMVSTVFSMPQAMEINLPPKEMEDDPTIVEVKESNLLTLRVDAESRYWWNIGKPSENLPQLLPSNPNKPDSVAYAFYADTLQGLLVSRNRANDKLNTLVLIHKDADYEDMVNILDDIDVIERSWNAFTAKQKGVEPDELAKSDKFSYRYALGVWEERDDKIISESILAAQAEGKL
ncbi:MAG: biopolymer transporter ExbD [candidate division Zixibacteria bacterium]|nr:biopolymer transporter ExbD [candidate division Zixibacteria bacterium]